jgi:hypothetical protein
MNSTYTLEVFSRASLMVELQFCFNIQNVSFRLAIKFDSSVKYQLTYLLHGHLAARSTSQKRKLSEVNIVCNSAVIFSTNIMSSIVLYM